MRRTFYYSILIFIFSMIIGFYYSVQWKNHKIAVEKDENEIVQETSFSDEKIGFDTQFALKKYYKKCGHFQISYAEIPDEFINMTKEDVEENYPDWSVEEFSKDRLILSLDVDSLCDEHYVIRLNDNLISVYHQNQFDNIELYQETDISTEYLTENDISRLEEGIYVYGRNKLNSVLEDFE